DRLLGGGPAALLDARALLDPLVARVDRLDDLAVGDHPRRSVGADAVDAGVRGAVGTLYGGHDAPPSGCSRISGCPGDTRSPSSTSHSTIWPPCAAVTPIRSRRLATSPIGD